MSAKAQPQRGALQQAKKDRSQQATKGGRKGPKKPKPQSKKSQAKKQGPGKQSNRPAGEARADTEKGQPRQVWGPRNLIKFEEDKEPRRGAGAYELRIYTRKGRDTLRRGIKPTAYLYRDLVAMLAQGGYGFAIAEVNNVVNKYASEAINEANKTRELMERAIRGKEETAQAAGLRLRIKDRGPGLEVEIGSVGGVTTSLAQLVKSVDEAIHQCEVAYSIDAAPHTVTEDATTKMIRWSIALKGAVKVMARYVRQQLPEDTIEIRVMRLRVQDAVQNHLKGKHRAADAAPLEGEVEGGRAIQDESSGQPDESRQTEEGDKAASETQENDTAESRPGFMSRVFGKE